MNVAELIERLQTMPASAPVRVFLHGFHGCVDYNGQFNDEKYTYLDADNDSLEADTVSWEGNHVRIESVEGDR